MYVVYIAKFQESALVFQEYCKTRQSENLQAVSIKRSTLNFPDDMICIFAYYSFLPPSVAMLSPRTALAARFYIFVFSQLISSTAGNFTYFKTNFKSYPFAVIVNYFSRYKMKFFIYGDFHSFVLIQLIVYMETKEGCFL